MAQFIAGLGALLFERVARHVGAKRLLSCARQSSEEPGPAYVNTVVEETLLLGRRRLGQDGRPVRVTASRGPRARCRRS
jgi:hypothetical protein